jgi:predicted DNA-binding protein
MTKFTVELNEKLGNNLKYLSLISKREPKFYIEEALICYLEDVEDIKETLNSIEENKGQKTYTTEEVLAMLDKNDGQDL